MGRFVYSKLDHIYGIRVWSWEWDSKLPSGHEFWSSPISYHCRCRIIVHHRATGRLCSRLKFHWLNASHRSRGKLDYGVYVDQQGHKFGNGAAELIR